MNNKFKNIEELQKSVKQGIFNGGDYIFVNNEKYVQAFYSMKSAPSYKNPKISKDITYVDTKTAKKEINIDFEKRTVDEEDAFQDWSQFKENKMSVKNEIKNIKEEINKLESKLKIKEAKISNDVLDKIMDAKSVFVRNKSEGDLIIAIIPIVAKVKGDASNIHFVEGANTITMSQYSANVKSDDGRIVVIDGKNLSYIITYK